MVICFKIIIGRYVSTKFLTITRKKSNKFKNYLYNTCKIFNLVRFRYNCKYNIECDKNLKSDHCLR